MISYNSLIQLQIASSESYVDEFAEVLTKLSQEIEEEYLHSFSQVKLNFVDPYTVLIDLEHEEDHQLYEVIGYLASSLYREGFGQFSFLINNIEYDF
jgi:hypothetical protein